MVAEVIINRAAKEINRTFDYIIPKELENLLQIGARVFVPIGNGQEIGYVTKIKDKSDFDLSKLKEIYELIDDVPLLNDINMKLAYAISKRYFTSLGKSLELMIPQGLRKAWHKELIVNDQDNLNPTLAPFFKEGKAFYNSDLKKYQNLIIEQINNGVLEEKFILEDKGSIKKVAYVSFINDSNVRSSKSLELINYLKEIGNPILKTELLDLGYSESSLKTLIKNENVKLIYKDVYRDINVEEIKYEKVVLNNGQSKVYETIKSKLNTFEKFLIHGVCGSGKTEIYLNLIEDVLNQGKSAIMLVPEISLTPQMASRFKSRFNDKVAIIHSRLTINEKYDEYRRIKKGLARIVLGVRSAIFSPIKNLGIIIMDEEQEESYIQDSTPSYDTHFVSEFLAKEYNCPIVLGSATPKVSTYYYALNNEYKLLNLYKRANNKPMESSEVVDMREELKTGNRTVFSNVLRQEIKNNYTRNEQTILFLNRRGYSTSFVCRSCGETIKCPNCDVPLTFHKTTNKLKCHYCNFEMRPPKKCPNCGSPWIKEMGSGTEKVEEELKKLLPEARILRMDQDTLNEKDSYTKYISAINNHECDIVLGTQIVAKGLDFPLVSLVGVVNADLNLYMPTYDAYEKTYDLIEQVSGRAGRKNTKGRCIIQTYNPDNSAILSASKHSYLEFYKHEIRNREISKNPPFSDLIQLLFVSHDSKLAFVEANKVKARLLPYKNLKVLGPVTDRIYFINKEYRVVLTVKALRDSNVDILNQIEQDYLSLKNIKLFIKRM